METRRLSISIPPLSIALDTYSNPEALLDELIAKGESHEDVLDERIPYWAELWPSALGMAQFLAARAWSWEELQVHEIGCGLGLPGIVAGLLGSRVTFSDYLPEALEFTRRNWTLNCSRSAVFKVLDWRNPDDGTAADILIASDVAYESRAFEPLLSAFAILCKPGGKVLLSEPYRESTAPFLHRLESLYEARRYHEVIVWQGKSQKAQILELGMPG